MPGYLVVSRPGALSGWAVGHRILINGQQAGTVRNNSWTGFTLPPGRYQVRTTSGGSRSQELSIDVAENMQTVLLSQPNNVVTLIGGAVGAVVGVGSVVLGTPFALFLAVMALSALTSLAIGRFRPGSYLRLRAVAVNPVAPWSHQAPQFGRHQG